MKEKEKHELEQKHFKHQMKVMEERKMELKLKYRELEDMQKKLKKKEHMILLSNQSYQTLKKMHEKDKAFWDEQLNEQRKKNEKLTMELANIFKNSIQNKSAEEQLKNNFRKKYEKLATEMNLKEENFKNKFAQSVKSLEKNKSSLMEAKQKLESEKRNLQEKMKNMEKLSSQVLELKGKESRLVERLEQQEKKFNQEIQQLRQRYGVDVAHFERKVKGLETKVENIEEDNKKKQKQLFAGK